MRPEHVTSLQWHHAMDYARQACARVFRDGGSPGEAVRLFGLRHDQACGWDKAVEQIAGTLCRPANVRRAA